MAEEEKPQAVPPVPDPEDVREGILITTLTKAADRYEGEQRRSEAQANAEKKKTGEKPEEKPENDNPPQGS